jgi:hypothetical protein
MSEIKSNSINSANQVPNQVQFLDEFEVVVVGAGHAGCEAALAVAPPNRNSSMKSMPLVVKLARLPIAPICKSGFLIVRVAQQFGHCERKLTSANMPPK